MQYDPGLPVRPLPGNQAKVPPSARCRLRERQVEPRVVIQKAAEVMDFNSYAAFFAVSPAGQAELDRRVGEDAERNAAKKAEAEAARVAKELEQLNKANATQELMAATAAQLKEQRRPEQGERGEYQVFRIGQESGQPWPTDE